MSLKLALGIVLVLIMAFQPACWMYPASFPVENRGATVAYAEAATGSSVYTDPVVTNIDVGTEFCF